MVVTSMQNIYARRSYWNQVLKMTQIHTVTTTPQAYIAFSACLLMLALFLAALSLDIT